MGNLPMGAVPRDFDSYLDRTRRSAAIFLINDEKNALLLLDWPEYQPTLRSTATHGQDGHAT